MHKLAQLLPTSALRFSRMGFARSKPSFPIPTRFPACSKPVIACHGNARLLSSSAFLPEHPVSGEVEKAIKPSQTPEERWKERSRRALEDVQNKGPANAYTGRSVKNSSEKQVAASFRQLEGILARNKVRQQLRLTERHEKKGVKRRRLSSERWRKRFANEVRKKVQLVIKIRDRGA